MMKLQNKTILITGASSGIGKAMALKAAQDGATVLLAARNEDKLNEVAKEVEKLGGKAEVIVCDVTDASQVKNMFLKSVASGRVLDVVFDNAGLGYIAPIQDLTTDQIKKTIDLNIFGMITVAKFASEIFTRQKHGHLIMTSSIAGLVTVPQWSVYVASKWAITGFAGCIRPELKRFGIKVSTLHPGVVETDFFAAEKANIDFTKLSKAITSQEVAQAVYKAIFTNKKKIIIPGIAKSYSLLYRYMPNLTEKMLEGKAGEIEYHDDIHEDEVDFDFVKEVK